MEKTALRDLLTRLCANSLWKYAVFWKLEHLYQTLLTWEDGYCDYTKGKKTFNGKPGLACSSENSKLISFENQPAVSDRSSTDFSIGFAIGCMSRLQYAIGEGVIGRVALTGDDNWVFFHNSAASEIGSPKPEFPEEWNLQVTAGIETILLVPLLPLGVLQLGSFEKVPESLSVVSEIKDKLNSSFYKDNLVQSALPDNDVCSSSTRPLLVINREEAKPWCMKLPGQKQFEDLVVISVDKAVNGHLSNYSEPILPSAVQNIPEALKNNLPAFLEHSSESDLSNSSLDSLNLSDLVGQHTNTNAQETICDLLTSYMDDMDEVIRCSLLYGENDHHFGHSGDTSDGFANSYLHEDVLEEPLTFSDDTCTSPTVAGTLFGIPVDCELLRGFETVFPEENYYNSWDLCEPNYYRCVSPTHMCSSEDLISSFDPSPWEYSGYFGEGNHEKHRRESDRAVPSINEQSDDVNSCTILSSGSSITSLVKNVASSPASSLSEEATEESVPSTHESMSFFTGVDYCHSNTLTPSSKSGIRTPTEEKKRKKRSLGPSIKGEKQTVVSEKARTNDGYKPRPRDRQLIQDRLKELRDLVPNGEKCSIDGLLDRVIKHMQFLSNVTDQAEKLRYTVDEERASAQFEGSISRPVQVLEDENGESEVDINCSSYSNPIVTISLPSLAPLPRENKGRKMGKILAGEKLIEANSQQKGTSSAVEDLKLYPVTVKDLSRPGSMLIEMVCNEEELFFEITKVISHLGLTILKSIMETNSGNTSAQFIVEAPRGFSKVEIFFPLMQLSQRRRNTTMPVVV